MAAATVFSDSESSSSGGEDSTGRRLEVENSILSGYLKISGHGRPDLSKIRSILSSSSSSSSFSACLICLDRVRPDHPIWSCSSGCHAVFHLACIQSWASQPPYRPSAASSDWPCPKCRLSYPKTLIPRSYYCFCGKVENPPVNPWALPHSCGELCERALRPECGHHCLLLCHPGPCPPCPQLVTSSCFCGSVSDVRRCAHKYFSCGKPCSKPLDCGLHPCPERCHEGPCPPCRVKGVCECACGRTKEERECCERGFQCENPCESLLACGKHRCERGCHSGPCGDCPLQGRRTCPCGKKEYKGVSCDVNVPTCGSTCEKLLSCGLHRCPERCHRGPCVETCRTVLIKSCRCGSLKKEVPCYQDLVCERKCQRTRDCGKHACRRRCCDGSCPPCPEICGRKLRCNNHKCHSPCHRGTCAPCPLMVTIPCACGETSFEVPCGLEMNQKPPRCPKPCPIPRLCRHKSQCRPHRCHYGSCPPCRLVCCEEFSCGHSCRQRCHGPMPPPNPEFTLKPKKKKKMDRHVECTPGSPCPPCQEVVLKSCLGQHIERTMLCSNRKRFSCDNLCGNMLPCGNHFCTKSCHLIKTQSCLTSDAESELAESCDECFLSCQKVRELACPHPCPLPCHSGNCPPCKVLVKRACHCGSMVHVFECTYYNSLSDEEQQTKRSCGGPCHRKLPSCPHLCSEICHPGQCPSDNQCGKKVTIRCACNNLKKEWVCQDVLKAYRNSGRDPKDITKNQFGNGLLTCNADCASKLKVAAAKTELHLRKTEIIQSTPEEVTKVPKRRKKRERVQEVRHMSTFQVIKTTLWKSLMFTLLILVIIATAYFGYKGIFLLSDWMNELDSRRLRHQHPRF
ncbi:NF-X1-type zinc finger protein NFXL1 protein [Dioscorea alata]|uniref:NF-X1-type zinc finger protein NFXL1 protein n=1 Tax=Dioscorea alata TaxID=55571 RepID=A0ACB7VTA4_DIOAL|nr:NF-X1-type zinc finger protein NFXL1 protein [Dioscorea alata]